MTLVTSTQTYTLRLTVDSCCELEDRTQQDFDTLTQRVNRGRVTELRWLLWAALQAKHADVMATPEHVTALVDALGGPKAIRPVLSALLALNANDDVPRTKGEGKPMVDERPGSLWRRLYLDARCLGLSAEDFWRLSLRELWREMAAARQLAAQHRERDITQAWWIAMLVWQKRLPDLETLLGKRARHSLAARQSWQEMKAAMKQISGAIDEQLAPT